MGPEGPADVPSRCLAKFFLFTASVEWRFIIDRSPEKGFCKERVNVLCPEDQNNPQRQQLSHTQPSASPQAALPALPGLLSEPTAQPGLTPTPGSLGERQKVRIHAPE